MRSAHFATAPYAVIINWRIKMSFFLKKWKITIIVIAVIAAASFVLEHFIGDNPIAIGIRTITSPVRTGFSYITGEITGFRDFIIDMRAYKADNERLEAENIELKRQNRDVAVYREENERLKEMLELKESMTNYSMVAARIISYSDSNWYDSIEINKGAVNGISEGNAVITPDGVVGRVTKVGPNYSIVTTILDPSAAIGIRISRTGGNGLVEGDEELSRAMQCQLTFLDRSTPVIIDDIVETSGTGGIYPPGLVIGTIVNIAADSTGNLINAVVAPAVDFDSLQEVLVINGAS